MLNRAIEIPQNQALHYRNYIHTCAWQLPGLIALKTQYVLGMH